MIDKHVDAKEKLSLDAEGVYNLFPYFIFYLAAPRPTLGHCGGGSLTNPILITAFDTNATQS